ncbi:MAG: hypothetical protein JWP27_947 [Flaviaesturariibacter sp.]|nr:hypothetical protein [Flaviaesturariibacter sp.]
MKKTVLFLLALLALTGLKAQVAAQPGDILEVKESVFDFGKIPQGKPVFHFFDVVNHGTKPLRLDNVQASCGCTTPEWSKDEIPAGGTSRIRVGYNAASSGGFEKYITVTYNGNDTKQIKIKGEVWQAPAGAAPANASIQFLKQQIQ